MKIEDLKKESFTLEKKQAYSLDLALISLRLAIKAYFSTYKANPTYLGIINSKALHNTKAADNHHTTDFCEASTETIFHFQHFAELSCKKILRDVHPLLCDVAIKKPLVLYKLLKNESLTADESQSVKSIEFSETLENLIVLINKKALIDHDKLSFIIEHKETLKALNDLRNRISHRGLFIMRYKALDIFIGKYIFPFVIAMTDHCYPNSTRNYWFPKKTACSIDPIHEIITECNLTAPNHKKIALLKEMGRASYENPLEIEANTDKTVGLTFSELFNERTKKRAVQVANFEQTEGNRIKIKCPVCGMPTLIIYKETHCDDDDGTYFDYAYEAKCECCTFSIHYDVDIPDEYEKFGIENYWNDL
ncbi:MAG: hypothetical protein Q7T36_14775 [Fluviicoccus sp.]|uniref:hypothetical protein n=1 Tax=Fluviicoccus sp. TaxID=2003552 RepID=UPI002728D6F9|nr:hypothetical protein [Fluviicoccus sp.]MDO8331728.1 hypothetical protein [Fluviicoccus sp.]